MFFIKFIYKRGRDICYQMPPSRIPACDFPAQGSSERLALHQNFRTVLFQMLLLVLPAVRLADILQHYASGTCFLYGLRRSATPFPM